nr:MAG TPA: hypothetical protein [Caudoviricetes sp.]
MYSKKYILLFMISYIKKKKLYMVFFEKLVILIE